MSVVTKCINGMVKAGDFVLSTIDSEYPCLFGRVLEVIPLGSPDHDTENRYDDVVVDFRQDYSDKRVKQIEECLGALYGKPTPIGESGIDNLIMPPDCLLHIAEPDMHLVPSFLADELYAIVYGYRVIRRILREREPTPALRPVSGKYYEPQNGHSKLLPFSGGRFHQWGISSIQVEDGVVTDTVAIVELPDGVVRTVYPNHLQFDV